MKIENLRAIGWLISYNIRYKRKPSIHKQISNIYFSCNNVISIVVRFYSYYKGKQYIIVKRIFRVD